MPSVARKLQIIRLARRTASPHDTIASAIEQEVSRFSHQLKHPNKSKHRRCFTCNSWFRPVRDNNYYCSRECQHSAHYIRFNVHNLRKGN